MGTVRSPWRADDDHAPTFRFVTVEETRLRYLDCGSGQPVVLLHGNGSMIEDFLSSGIIERAAPDHRFIAFDRPGFGHSDRPHGRSWGPGDQATLLCRALRKLGIERPIVVGHSWGALVALAMGLLEPEFVSGLVLMSGYYYPVAGAKPFMLPTAFPFASDVVRHTVVPFMRRLMAPDTLRRVFAPCAVPDRFRRTYPLPLALRASQMRAVDEEAAMLPDVTAAFRPLYRELRPPVHLIAGSDDRIVETDVHSARLHQDLSASTFHRVVGCGHMVHHAVPDDVAAAIAQVRDRAGQGRGARPRHRAPRRQWLHIGDSAVAA